MTNSQCPAAARLGRGASARLLIAMLALFAAAGCGIARQASTSDAERILRTIDSGYRASPDMAIEGTVRVSGVPATVWFDALIRARDSMKITLIGPFGIPLGAMSATRRAFEFYKADEDIVVFGAPDRPTFSKLLMIPLDYDELIALLRGEIPRVPMSGEYTARPDGELLVFTVERDDRVEQIAVDPAVGAVRTYRRSLMLGDSAIVELEITYSAFEPFAGRQLARRALVDVAAGAQRINVTVDDVAAELPEDAVFGLEVPPGTVRQHFRP